MSKNKSDTKKKNKSSQLVIRIEKAERDTFVKLCDQMDTSAAREIRRFMRDWVAKHTPVPEYVAPAEADVQAEPESVLPEVAAETPKARGRSKRKDADVATG
jgi:hypothetical protein